MTPQRIDYYYDSPEAPQANSLVPAVNVVVVNDAGEILLVRRTDNGNWAVPESSQAIRGERSELADFTDGTLADGSTKSAQVAGVH